MLHALEPEVQEGKLGAFVSPPTSLAIFACMVKLSLLSVSLPHVLSFILLAIHISVDPGTTPTLDYFHAGELRKR